MDLASLFRRDLTRLINQLEAFPDSESLWRVLPGITNSAGNLTLHLDGNLREFIGRQLGDIPYTRNRELEFASTASQKEELIGRITELRTVIPSLLEKISPQRMKEKYPQDVLGIPLSVEDFLIHLYGHLNWHLGQMDYLRRALTADGAIPAANL